MQNVYNKYHICLLGQEGVYILLKFFCELNHYKEF